MRQFIVALALAGVATHSVLRAQERIGSGSAMEAPKAPGWTFTPTVGVAETYDDNVSLFAKGTAAPSDDYISTVFPGADLTYVGQHTRLGMGYSGSFLDYRTFSTLNRWDQRAHVDFRRQETARLSWFATANGAKLPSTDLIDFGGIPYRHEGATTYDASGGVGYTLGERDNLSTSLAYQSVTFQQSETFQPFLHGGNIAESTTAYRHTLTHRLSVGADYSFRHASVRGEPEQFDISTVEAAADYQLSSAWSMGAGAGAVYLQANALTPARTGPALRFSIEHHQELRIFALGYLRTYIPSFGFGGTTQNQEIHATFQSPLFHSRHYYTAHSLVFRDDKPLTSLFAQLPLRSLTAYSVVGWAPQNWVRFEAFYARVQQSTLLPGGQVDRDRVGIQIVTSKPMRIQ